jgi:hypothetical protein
MRKKEPKEEIFVELLINLEGSVDNNRITTFKLPILERIDGAVRFETKELVNAIQKAVRKLI